MSFIKQFQKMGANERESVIDDKVSNSMHEITQDGTFCDCSAGTNATDWGVDDYEFDADYAEIVDDEVHVPLDYHASGEQLDDHMYCGTEITGEAVAVIDDKGQIRFEEVTAEVAEEIAE